MPLGVSRVALICSFACRYKLCTNWAVALVALWILFKIRGPEQLQQMTPEQLVAAWKAKPIPSPFGGMTPFLLLSVGATQTSDESHRDGEER